MAPSVPQTSRPSPGMSWRPGLASMVIRCSCYHVQSFILSTAEQGSDRQSACSVASPQSTTYKLACPVNAGSGSDNANSATADILKQAQAGGSAVAAPVASWQQYEGEGISIAHRQPVTFLTWHAKGDYFASVSPTGCHSCVC